MIKYDEIVCTECFNDEELKEIILENDEIDDCPWCGAKNVNVIPIIELGDLFRQVAEIYQPVNIHYEYQIGDPISHLMQEDWNIFSDKITESADNLMDELMIAILEAGTDPKDDVDLPNYNGSFERKEPWLEENWDLYIEKMLKEKIRLRAENYNLSDEGINLYNPDFIEVAFEEATKEYRSGTIFYRARIHKERKRVHRYDKSEMGAPPTIDINEAGRVNSKDEIVLYMSSKDKTAISEVRPWKGAAVAVAKMKLQKTITVIDLLKRKKIKSPFFEDMLDWKLQVNGLFYRFAEDLSRPLMPSEQEDLYKPTQNLSSLIKKAGYDGIVYPSAMAKGYNIVTFDPEVAKPVDDVKYFRIGYIHYHKNLLNEHDEIYEETPYDFLLNQNIII